MTVARSGMPAVPASAVAGRVSPKVALARLLSWQPARSREPRALLLVIAALLLGLFGCIGGMGAYYAGVVRHSLRELTYDPNLARAPEARSLLGSRALATTAMDLLLVLTEKDGTIKRLADSVEVLRLSADRRTTTLVSLPADLAVPGPDSGVTTLARAYRDGGNNLLARSVEAVTGVKLTHVLVMSLADALAFVDLLDGVAVRLDRPLVAGDVTIPAGIRVLDSSQARAYIGVPGSDTSREARIQRVVQALIVRMTTSLDLLLNPMELAAVLEKMGGCTTADPGMTAPEAIRIALDLRGRVGELSSVSLPVTRIQDQLGKPLALPQGTALQELSAAFQEDRLATQPPGGR